MSDGDALHELGERVKELTALHRATRFLLDPTLTRELRLQAIADLLPPAFQYPEIATAAVRHRDATYIAGAHAATPWVITSAFETSDGMRGEVEVAYHDARPDAAHGPFLAEEAALLGSLADMIRGALDRDIAENAMREANDRLNLALDTAGTAFWEWDLRTNVVRWSRQLAAMVGLDGEQVGPFLTFSHFVHEDDRPALQRWLERAAHEDIRMGKDLRLRRPDGGWRPLVVYTDRVRAADGTPIRLLASLVDQTERQALEDELRQAQKVDALGRVASGVAHDFNNLLTVILTGTHLLSHDLPEDHPSRQLVDDMQHAAESGAAMTRQLLSFSRKATFQPSAIDLCALARRTQPILERLAGKGATFGLMIDVNECSVWADPAQIEQVLINLVVNARDAMESGNGATTLTIAIADAALVARARLAPGRYVRLSVADRGPGIPAGMMDHLFEPFFTTKESGTGLGLAVVSRVARQWNGGVVVDSVPGAGATFHVLLPQLAA